MAYLSKFPIMKQILLIVKPGIATDANPCQMAASIKASVQDLERKSCGKFSLVYSGNDA